MPSSIDVVEVTGADLVEKCCDAEFVAIGCVGFVAVGVLDFVPEFGLPVAERFELRSAFDFADLVQPSPSERCVIVCAYADDLSDKNLNQMESLG